VPLHFAEIYPQKFGHELNDVSHPTVGFHAVMGLLKNGRPNEVLRAAVIP
jgi:hypothetical protein